MASQVEGSDRLEGLHRADTAFLFSALFRRSPRPYLWVELNNRLAERASEDLRFFLPRASRDQVLLIPASEADPYRGLSPHPEIAEKRAVGLWRLVKGYQGIVVTTLVSFLSRIPSPRDFQSCCMKLEVGGFIPMNHLLTRLRELGYVREDPVSGVGEYSARGGIVDVYSPAHQDPIRVEFFGDQIESLRRFDPGTQRSIELIPSCEVVPMREMVLSEADLQRWTREAPQHWNQVRFADALQEKLQFTENGELFNGFEGLLPLVMDHRHHLLEFFSDSQSVPVVLPNADEFVKALEGWFSRQGVVFREMEAEGELVLPPERLFFSSGEALERLEGRPTFRVKEIWDEPDTSVRFDFQPERKYHGRIQDLLADLGRWQAAQERVVFAMSSEGMAKRVAHLLADYQVATQLVEGGMDQALAHSVSVLHGKVSESFYSPHLGLHILSEDNLFEEGPIKPSSRQSTHQDLAAKLVSDFRDLRPGDYVVHIDHGIGVFEGLQPIGVGPDSNEFVVLTYRDGAKLYLPIDRLDSIQKYSGAGGARPQVDRLGGVTWAKTKRRIKKSMRQLAEELLRLYARRELAEGHAFSPDDALSREFAKVFEFEETPDQLAAIQATLQDMEGPRPMDRLICGDVGYGKTEVAMRAAFKAANDGKQSAVLAPTTVLALQHYNTFKERFRGFPVNIELVSRFQNRNQQKDILERTASGLVDILIGTHRLLSRDVQFRDLGLIVVDEEQRFGVSQKERLKQLKAKVDVLALSATPIPRTLNLSLIGLRDLSIIETPPEDRLAIQTVVVKFSPRIIRSAIDLELKRQGQVFFVHNSVESIYSVANLVQEIVSEARVAVAHGQMKGPQLEKIMVDFMNYQYDVLVATTIVENGLDIPRANTLIVNRSDRFGLAQLYQLRGRVGRSSRRAYAYFMIPPEDALSGDAAKRLAAIKEFSDLGAGFRIAAFDLEIRGAGNLLGAEQHGHINTVGFELYLKLLEQTIQELKGEEVSEAVQTTIDLGLDVLIPDHYIGDPSQRLWLYKRVSSAKDRAQLENLKREMMDRFGKYPTSVAHLFEYARLRLRARQLRIISLERKGERLFLKFRTDTPVSRQHLIDLISRGQQLALRPEGTLTAPLAASSAPEICEDVHRLLDQLAVLE